MQNDSGEICTTGPEDSRPLSGESVEPVALQTERVPLKRKSEEDLELESGRNKRRATGEAQTTMVLNYNDNEHTTKGTGEELNKGSEEKQMEEPLEQDRKVIIMKGRLPKLALPEDWIALNHRSGGIIYLHKPTRVCTWSRPYFIGGGSVRKHDVPLAAIPCLHQRRGLSIEEKKDENTNSKNSTSNQGGSILNVLNVKDVQNGMPNGITVKENTCNDNDSEKSGLDGITSLTGTADVKENTVMTESGVGAVNGIMEVDMVTESGGVTEQCGVNDHGNVTLSSKIAENFNNNCSKPVTSAKEVGKQQQETTDSSKSTLSTLELLEAGELGTYLSTLWEFQALTPDQERYAVIAQPQAVDGIELPPSLECHPFPVKGTESGKNPGKDCLLNAGGKTPVAILHEYCQRVLRTKPIYLASECDSAESPFVAEVQIDGIKYGSGTGPSKKIARQIAAEYALEVLLPGMFKKIRDYQISEAELEFFDQVDILNPRLHEFCLKTSLPNPSQMLEECIRRNQGVCSSIQFTTLCGQDKSLSFQITCGKHTATGPCKNKRIGKQLASQHILKKLHPHLEKWGALIRIYCDRPTGSIKKYKTEDNKTVSDQEEINSSTNTDLLDRLKSEMRKLYVEDEKTKKTVEKNKSPEPVFTVAI